MVDQNIRLQVNGTPITLNPENPWGDIARMMQQAVEQFVGRPNTEATRHEVRTYNERMLDMARRERVPVAPHLTINNTTNDIEISPIEVDNTAMTGWGIYTPMNNVEVNQNNQDFTRVDTNTAHPFWDTLTTGDTSVETPEQKTIKRLNAKIERLENSILNLSKENTRLTEELAAIKMLTPTRKFCGG